MTSILFDSWLFSFIYCVFALRLWIYQCLNWESGMFTRNVQYWQALSFCPYPQKIYEDFTLLSGLAIATATDSFLELQFVWSLETGQICKWLWNQDYNFPGVFLLGFYLSCSNCFRCPTLLHWSVQIIVTATFWWDSNWQIPIWKN